MTVADLTGRPAERVRRAGDRTESGNAVTRVGPDDDPRSIVDAYTEVDNVGTTSELRACAPLLRDNGRLLVVASSLGTTTSTSAPRHGATARATAWPVS